MNAIGIVEEPHRPVTRSPNAVEAAFALPGRPQLGAVRPPLPDELAGALEHKPPLSGRIRFLIAKDQAVFLDGTLQGGIRAVAARDMTTLLGQLHGAIGGDPATGEVLHVASAPLKKVTSPDFT